MQIPDPPQHTIDCFNPKVWSLMAEFDLSILVDTLPESKKSLWQNRIKEIVAAGYNGWVAANYENEEKIKIIEQEAKIKRKELKKEKLNAALRASNNRNLENLIDITMLTPDEIKKAILLQKTIRKWLNRLRFSRAVYSLLSDKKLPHFKRIAAVKEFIATEKIYVSELDIFVNHYFYKIKEKSRNNEIELREDEINSIFSSIDVIYKFNLEFLKELRLHQKKRSVVEIFASMANGLRLYMSYVSNCEGATYLYLDMLKKYKKFRNFTEKLEQEKYYENKNDEHLEEKGKNVQKLGAYIVLPAQRIMRYPMLIKAIIDHTTPDHKEYPSLLKLRDEVTKIANIANEKKRTHEQVDEVLKVQHEIFGINSETSIVTPTRRYINQESLILVENKLIDIQFYLFNDLILIAEKKKNSLTFKCNLELNNCKLTKASNSKLDINFLINCKGINYAFKLPDAAKLKNEISNQIEVAIGSLRRTSILDRNFTYDAKTFVENENLHKTWIYLAELNTSKSALTTKRYFAILNAESLNIYSTDKETNALISIKFDSNCDISLFYGLNDQAGFNLTTSKGSIIFSIPSDSLFKIWRTAIISFLKSLKQ
eukprot:TRINITY_DN2907_c2_g3_i2.p1 TRINITY_DN2907_c2_g3~~TRINITY_DN2907_c2_g3_i2.p1  ORF type:complete len:598 (+),score=186.19 TRINITY_DN2907_c2_g3_i2:102-1895(+)